MGSGVGGQIQEKMALVRREIDEDMGEVVDQARELADWKNFVKRNPYLTVGAAAALAFLIVPSRHNEIRPDAETLLKLAKKNRLVVKPESNVRKRGNVAGPIMSFAASALLRSVLTMAGSQAGTLFAPEQENVPS